MTGDVSEEVDAERDDLEVVSREVYDTVDPETADDVFSHLRAIIRGTGAAALIVTHNEKLAQTMDRCLAIKDGQIVER